MGCGVESGGGGCTGAAAMFFAMRFEDRRRLTPWQAGVYRSCFECGPNVGKQPNSLVLADLDSAMIASNALNLRVKCAVGAIAHSTMRDPPRLLQVATPLMGADADSSQCDCMNRVATRYPGTWLTN